MHCHKVIHFPKESTYTYNYTNFTFISLVVFLWLTPHKQYFTYKKHFVKWTQGRRIYNIDSRPIESAVEYGHVIEGFCQHISSKYRGFHLYNFVVHKDPDPTDFSFCERLMKTDMAVVKIEMATGSVIRCQFHQCPMSGFCASRFMLILLALSVDCTGRDR